MKRRPNQDVAHLSEREKMQFLHLTKTRELLAMEFTKTMNDSQSLKSGSTYSYSTSTKSRNTRGSVSRAGKRQGTMMSRTLMLPPIQTGLTMMPILATSGEVAMGGGVQGKLKLPIFKLPQMDAKQFLQVTQKTSTARADTAAGRPTFMTYFDKKSFKKVILHMAKHLPENERQFFCDFIPMTFGDINEITNELERRIDFDNEPSAVNGRRCIFVPTDLFKADYHCPSVFMFVLAPASKHSDSNTISSKPSTAPLSNLNFSALGISSEFHSFIGANTKAVDTRQHLSRSASHQTMKKPSRGGGPQNDLTNKSSSELTRMLIESMSKMDRHANMIRRGIEDAQGFVDSKDTKVKVVIFSVGAERMQVALWKIVRHDLKRGFAAWWQYLRLSRRQERVKKFFRFMVVRNLALGANKLVLFILKANFVLWKKFADSESRRLLRERVERATIMIQSLLRRRVASKRVGALRQRRKYQKLYDSTIKIQALIRGTVVKMRYQASRVDRIQYNAATMIQRNIRGALARTRVREMVIRRKRAEASKVIQKQIRGILGRRRVRDIREVIKLNKCAVFIQKIVRGFVDRRTMTAKIIAKQRYKFAVKIQALVRGFNCRNNIDRKLAELQAHKDIRAHAATSIQAAFRGHHSRLLFKMKLYQLRKEKAVQYKAATAIITMVRGFMCRAELRQLKKERLDQWMYDARQWQEMWSDESQQWFYLNNTTGEALWEPSGVGYTKYDGSLVLASGEIIEDPKNAKKAVKGEDGLDIFGEEQEEAEASPKTKGGHKLCSECCDRVAIRACTDCGDKFCTKCYKQTHATGSRRNHTYTNIGPMDCAECELLLAGRWCVSCDEAYCNGCWKKVHSHGKRRFHPYSEVSHNGRIDSRIFTMDGEQLEGYDTSYNQQQSELEKSTVPASQVAEAYTDYTGYDLSGYGQTGGYDQNGGGYAAVENGDQTWTEYQDDQGYTYYYNNYTGESQYDSPY